MISKGHQKKNSNNFVNFLIDKGYWGELTVKFEEGNIVHMKLNKGLKIENLSHTELYGLFLKRKDDERKGFAIKDIVDKGEKVKDA